MDSTNAGVDSPADSSLFDDLDAVGTGTETLPPIAADGIASYPPAGGGESYRRKPRWRTFAVALAICLVAAVAFMLVRFFISNSASAAGADAAYSSARRAASADRKSLRTLVNSTKTAAAGLSAALPESDSAQTFETEWTAARKLVDDPPKYLLTQPQNQSEARSATQTLQAYDMQVQDCIKQLNTMKTTAGKDDATNLFLSNQSTLSTSLQTAQALANSITAAQKDASSQADPSSGAAMSLPIDQQAVSALTTAISTATTLTQASATGTPYEIAQQALKMASENTTLTQATASAQKALSTAQQQLQQQIQQQKAAAQQYAVTNGQIPQALIGTWKTGDGATMTFTADSLQGHSAQAESIGLDGIADTDGAKPVAAWKLTSNGGDDGIEDTQVVRYANGSTQFLVVSAHGETWKLTR